MNRKIKLSLIILLLGVNLSAQKQLELFPSDLNIKPFVANFLEPKVGFMFMSGKNSLRLDIGNSKDFIHLVDGNKIISFGGDFFTFTKLRGEADFHFPVDAVDYLFGLNGSVKIKNEYTECGMRVRLSHISAHFVDDAEAYGQPKAGTFTDRFGCEKGIEYPPHVGFRDT